MTPLPGQYEYCPGSDAISWAIRVLLLRGAVTADNGEAAPLKVGLLGLQRYMCVYVHVYTHVDRFIHSHTCGVIPEVTIYNAKATAHKNTPEEEERVTRPHN